MDIKELTEIKLKNLKLKYNFLHQEWEDLFVQVLEIKEEIKKFAGGAQVEAPKSISYMENNCFVRDFKECHYCSNSFNWGNSPLLFQDQAGNFMCSKCVSFFEPNLIDK